MILTFNKIQKEMGNSHSFNFEDFKQYAIM